ncbi:MAG TPA: chromate efflux transporter [Steroidobacteraceae bacterium]|nr:chromate efflux transporter [Steroidobacteraceae bacterium]
MRPAGSPAEVLRAFGALGLRSFGGPIAHLGYFRDEFVVRRGWLSEAAYADLVALCQFLPGPASSQVGFSIGLARAGVAGALAAWLGFTLPSAAALVAFAFGARFLGGAGGAGLLHGLQLTAVAIVAQAVLSMARNLAPDRARASIAVAALLIVLAGGSSLAQLAAIAVGGVAGLVLCRDAAALAAPELRVPVSRGAGLAALVLFAVLLLGLPLLRAATASQNVALLEAFYRSGALVFGGGHVVLPLLRDAVVAPGWVSDSTFLSGYGAAQAVPGPLFSFAAYLGAVVNIGPGGIAGAAAALIAIYAPGMLLLLGALPLWQSLRQMRRAPAVISGIHAAVVGLLAAALYDPIWTTAVHSRADLAVAAVGFMLLVAWRLPPLFAVLTGAAGGLALALQGGG